ncbi:sigma-54-dependent Fis family transcriptional regulator [candidate division KSB1 bacterium]|nr:sigma-54-dependent Fis family transcriptional regulator [candidate division KSB1 bacterium]
MEKVLLVDDERDILDDRSEIVSTLGYECLTALDKYEAIRILRQKEPDILLTDMKMPLHDGFELLQKTKEIDPHIPVIMITGYGTIELAVRAIKLGAYDYIQKPVSPNSLEIVIHNALEYRRTYRRYVGDNEMNAPATTGSNIIGKSNALQEVMRRASKIARSDANVMIYGESGTGKELIAKFIHENSCRSDESFIPLDCVALPPNLLESELFGYEQGAFTGATKSKPGVLELANKGTLFLDEITEFDLALQPKLLRVLQERKFRRLGGTKLIDINMRIISAMNKDPEQAVKSGQLRQDLFYRLNVVPIFIPPLRERREDIPRLVDYFINKFSPVSPYNIKGISRAALERLHNYNWPGNIRELSNMVEQMIALMDSDVIECGDLPENVSRDSCFGNTDLTFYNFQKARDESLNQFYRFYFGKLIKRYGRNFSKVADIAQISRSTLYRILKQIDQI